MNEENYNHQFVPNFDVDEEESEFIESPGLEEALSADALFEEAEAIDVRECPSCFRKYPEGTLDEEGRGMFARDITHLVCNQCIIERMREKLPKFIANNPYQGE